MLRCEASCSVTTDGANHDEVTQEVRGGVQGEGGFGGDTGGRDSSGAGEAPRCASQPDLRLEEAGSGQCCEPFRPWRRRGRRGRGGARARSGQALREDRPTDGRTGFLGQEARAMSPPQRRAMVERPAENLSVRRQCELLNVARSGVYRPKKAPSAEDLALMRRIDELHLELPFYGSRRMTFELNRSGRAVTRKRVRRLMRVMGIEALVPRPGTSKAAPGHKIYPYLLRGLKIVEPNHVWAADVTYIPMACGFLYLVAIIDWASRAVLAWRLSNTNDASFCAAALEEALLRFGKPRIFNTDQGSTFTAEAFAGKLAAAGVAISMDGRGRFMDNIFIERLWRSIKYEEVHLKAYADGREARAGIGSWMTFYNFRRPHQAMNNLTPMAVWRAGMDEIEAAARAVDMPLRLDNANALPTYPQQGSGANRASAA